MRLGDFNQARRGWTLIELLWVDFVGLDASTNRPQALLSGDDNLVVAGLPVQPGLLTLLSNAPVSWTANRHQTGGNFGLADGSAQWSRNPDLVVRLGQTGLATNRLAIP